LRPVDNQDAITEQFIKIVCTCKVLLQNIVRKTGMIIDHRLRNIWLIGIVLVVLTGWPSSPVQAGGEPVYCDCSPVARPVDWECGQPK
jgi:hypothetical protein